MTIMGQTISTNEKGLVSLTDLWKAGGGEDRNRPKEWLSFKGNQEFIQELAKGGNPTLFVQVKPGRNGGTFAHWQIALAYAKYLSPKLHMAVNDIYMRYKMADPKLAVEVAG
ncbi:KilA-N domain-containing protein [Solidesulfovibrio magneticus]|uniref:KilA-N domain-containing protein n=1 Tax=Solidesulfovibrio magneticus (strain ATCC 700980 / DSM 13731 / RS-1) TaxID=573370 RepID=C4XTA2_SOLM1|nr:KilA-N domain-containing protein [Solidesulfovibrio magneticus]BAH75899.1 hypothetical protein DMR_24080 [Solidesulfovibrio magneticus RS-1]